MIQVRAISILFQTISTLNLVGNKSSKQVNCDDPSWEWLVTECISSDSQNVYKSLQESLDLCDRLCETRAKSVLQSIRTEKYTTINYLGEVRSSFIDFVHRPDPKQEYVSEWQRKFNSIEFDLRFDNEVQVEWHQRLVDLIDQACFQIDVHFGDRSSVL